MAKRHLPTSMGCKFWRLEGNALKTKLVLAMSADGKISDRQRRAARFGSTIDQRHLEERIAGVDLVIFGAGTLRAYGTTLSIRQPHLLAQRQDQRRSPQPIHLVCSGSGDISEDLPFFRQAVPRWLLTTGQGADRWLGQSAYFQEVLIAPQLPGGVFDWQQIWQQLAERQIGAIAVLGGGDLTGALLLAEVIDEVWLTVCPLLLGGRSAPTPIDGEGLPGAIAPRLQLLSAQVMGDEVFLHYQVKKSAEAQVLP